MDEQQYESDPRDYAMEMVEEGMVSSETLPRYGSSSGYGPRS